MKNQKNGENPSNPFNALRDAFLTAVYEHLIDKLWQRVPKNVRSTIGNIFVNFFVFLPYLFFGLVGIILIWIATDWFSTNILIVRFGINVNIWVKLGAVALGTILEVIELIEFKNRKSVSNEFSSYLDLEQEEYKHLKYKITQAVFRMTYISSKNIDNLADVDIRFEAVFDIDIKDDMKVFEYKFIWSGRPIGKPTVYLTEGDLTVRGKEKNYTPEENVEIKSLPSTMGVAQVEVTFSEWKRKDEPNGQLHLVLVWLFKGQTMKAEPIVGITSNKFLFDLKKAIITLQLEAPQKLLQKRVYSKFTKPRLINTTETIDVKLTDSHKVGSNYRVVRDLGVGKEEEFRNRMVYGLAFYIRGRDEKVVNENQDLLNKAHCLGRDTYRTV